MGISKDDIERIRAALNPVDIIREAVPSLKQAGNRWRGLCPFHNERTPSFFFMPDKGLWHCFGSCGEGGDVFKFVMRMEKLTFPESVRHLARQAGVEIRETRDDGSWSQAEKEREQVLEALSKAADFYQNALLKSAEAEQARRYLAKRGLKPETIQTFRLGYVPRQGFVEEVLRKGGEAQTLTKAGLAVRSDRTGRYHDPLMNRLIFPIFDAFGRVVGFGGRRLDDNSQSPKYINSPETVVYSKSRHLYGLYQGRTQLRDKEQALLVEGYMDVIGCHQAGYSVAVAPLGTAFTQEQAKLLKRYVKETVLLFDPDEAGVRASWRSAGVLLKEDLFVRVGHVPDKMDPDELILKKGTGAMDQLLASAQDVVDFWLAYVAKVTPNFDQLNQRIRRAQELLGLIREIPNEILHREWVRKIAQRLCLDEGALVKELAKGQGRRSAQQEKIQASQPEQSPKDRVCSVEEEILQIIASAPQAGLAMAESLPGSLFTDGRCRNIYEKFLAQLSQTSTLDVGAITRDLDANDSSWLSSLLMEGKSFESPKEALSNRLDGLKFQKVQRERRQLETEVLAMLEGRLARDEQKIGQYQDIMRSLAQLSGKVQKSL